MPHPDVFIHGHGQTGTARTYCPLGQSATRRIPSSQKEPAKEVGESAGYEDAGRGEAGELS